ncbi:cadherin-related family member 1, partial [Biomphalaria glabrata]
MTTFKTWGGVLLVSVSFLIIADAQTLNNPQITPFTRPYNIHEDTIVETQIVEVVCTNPGDACLCNLKYTDPLGGPFTVWKKTSLSKFYVYYTGVAQGGKLSFKNNPTYFLTIECRNELGTNTSEVVLEIDIQQNQAPVITNIKYPRDSIVLDAMRPYVPGDNFYQVTATDAESDALTFSITTNPSVNYFTIDASEGYINIAKDLRSATVKNILITASVTDGVNIVNNFEIAVNLTSLNTRPSITNLPATVKFPETTPAGTTLITLTLQDPDIFDATLVPTCSVVPNGEEYKFTYESGTRKLKLTTLVNTQITLPLDYESYNQYKITCVFSDGFLDSQNDTLTLNVENVNEAPTFDETIYYCDLYESGPGVSTCDLDAVIIDPDGDTISTIGFLTSNNNNRF